MSASIRRRLGVGFGIGGLLVCLASGASGAEANRTPVQAVAGGGTSITRLARAVGALPLSTQSVVVIGKPRTAAGVALTDAASERLWANLRQHVAPLVPAAKKYAESPLPLDQARLLARQSDLALTYLEPEIRGGSLLLHVTHRTWSASFWQRALVPEGTLAKDASFSVEADTAIRGLFPVGKDLLESPSTAPSPIAAPLAVACGEFSSSTREVVVVGRREIAIGAFEGERFVLRKKADWAEASAISPTPLRAPLAAAQFVAGALWVASSDRAERVELNRELGVSVRAPRSYPTLSGQCLSFTDAGISDDEGPCPGPSDARAPRSEPLASGEGFDAVARADLTEPHGGQSTFVARLPLGSTTLQISAVSAVEGERSWQIEGVGSALFMQDIDGNGTMDVVTSKGTTGSEPDGLVVYSLGPSGPEAIGRRSTETVHALAACPFSGKNPLSLVAVAGNQLLFFP